MWYRRKLEDYMVGVNGQSERKKDLEKEIKNEKENKSFDKDGRKCGKI